MNTDLSSRRIPLGRNSIFWLLAGFVFLLPALCLAASPGSLAVSVQTGVRVEMRDGISLVADIYRPAAQGKFPVLLQRTPYNRAAGAADAHLMASHGYVVILQDTRGRFDSEGEFYPFRHETEDGYDTVEWAAALEYANGKVGMFGGSYVGATQMLAAISKPPHLNAIFPYVTASEYYDGWTYQSGVLMQWFASSWTSGLTIDTLRRKANLRLRPKEWVESFPVENYRLLDLPTASELTGYITLELFAASSAADTDFTAIVTDVDPAGYARYLTDGIVRARYRNSTEKPEPIVPGQVYKYTIDLWATGNLFKAGHQIRLYVSSSNFPRFNRNLNTGEATLGSTKSLVAKQTVYHDAQHPSTLVLPVIPR